jgi:sporulation protein YlmC with PRC-barrel domain
MLLSDCLRSWVMDEGGARLGRLRDLSFIPDPARPAVTGLLVDERRVPWSGVISFREERVIVRPGGDAAEPAGERRLARDILDTQIFDVAGKRLTRVGDVLLEPVGSALFVAAVEIGAAPVLRRLGLRRLAGRLREERIEWSELHHAALPAHTLRLERAREKHMPPGRRFGRVLSLRRRAPA